MVSHLTPADCPRLVIKIGSSLLVDPSGMVRQDWLQTVVDDIAARRAAGQQIIIVSSGAIALGARRLGLPKGGRASLEDAQAAAAFRRLVRHLRHRHDAQNIDLMGLAGFCRNCLADWIREAGYPGDKEAARTLIHGIPSAEWKATRQTPATEEQLARMEASVAKNAQE